jgi:hypothetical protein
VLTKTNGELKNVMYNILNYTRNLAKFQILLLIINIITIMNLKNCTLKDKKTKFAKGLFYDLLLKGQLKEIENTKYLFQLETNRQANYLIKEIENMEAKLLTNTEDILSEVKKNMKNCINVRKLKKKNF